MPLEKCPNCNARIMPTPAEMLAIRKGLGLTQREIAIKLRVKASHIAYMETGQRHPGPEVILRYRKLAEAGLSQAEREAKQHLRSIVEERARRAAERAYAAEMKKALLAA